jgi:ketosteroid isomerase-like protein
MESQSREGLLTVREARDDSEKGEKMSGNRTGTGFSRRHFLAGSTALGLALASGRAMAADRSAAVIEADIANAEGVRAVKRLQHAWGQYAEAGDFASMADLFADNGRFIMPPAEAVGRSAIVSALRQYMAGGAAALGPDRLNLRLMLSPAVTLGADGTTAKGRWHEFAMTGVHGVRADWSGGIHENDYVLERGVWKIATLHLHPQFAGPYEKGWTNIGATVPFVPYHYTPDGAGTPVPLDPKPRKAAVVALPSLAARARALADEGNVQNLQAAYGFYMDRKQWDDVADLFAPDGVIEIGGEGAYAGRASIRKGLDRFGAAGLQTGQLFDHMQLMPVVDVAPDGRSAQLRCIELLLLGVHGKGGAWGVNICEMRAEKRGDLWMISRLTISPRLLADYDEGWAKGLVDLGGPSQSFPPDRAVVLVSAYPKAKGPAIRFSHPVSGKRSVPVPGKGKAEIAAIERDLHAAKARDGAENVSTAYGYYIDEFKWDETADLFSTDGWKELSYIGNYIGRESVRKSLFARYGRNGRNPVGAAIHQKVAPYVTVLPDGRACARIKLFQINTAVNPGSYVNGIYENQIVQENGVWKIAGMDLDYVFLADYKGGWAKVQPGSTARFPPKPEDAARMAPDGPLRGVTFAPYPEIGPTALHFVNPVSGRQPPMLLPWSDGHFR